MVTLLSTAIFIIGLLAVAVYFWQKPAKRTETQALPPPPPQQLHGLFSELEVSNTAELSAADAEAERAALIERAKAGDKEVLPAAQERGDQKLYHELLHLLLAGTTADTKCESSLLALISYVARHEFPVSKELAEAIIQSWKIAPGRGATARTLHIAALADDAHLYQSVVEAALRFWRAGVLADVSAAELKSLFDGEFWVLSKQTRGSGAGFLLKRTLAKARGELGSAMRVSQ
jgi:hypothetical protein